jgi:hypothetical protein
MHIKAGKDIEFGWRLWYLQCIASGKLMEDNFRQPRPFKFKNYYKFRHDNPSGFSDKTILEWLDSMVFTVIPKSHDFYTRQVGYHFSYGVQVPYWFVKDLLE